MGELSASAIDRLIKMLSGENTYGAMHAAQLLDRVRELLQSTVRLNEIAADEAVDWAVRHTRCGKSRRAMAQR